MGLSSVPDVQPNMQFLFKGLIWPTPEALKAHIDKAAQANPDLTKDTSAWTQSVLKPEFCGT